ncbi:LON peptidase substrate-binding domain-containing protein [Candidatus Levibacter sp. Uisw_134_01]|uniref:LON peptidase substrate-binding domain-containing protein n=1 Tax=Candidatus Levibacter sp. Uisw_134_01 TaxID=3230999 RepID=UPI003D3DB791
MYKPLKQIPIFPLQGVVMFPNTYLPLNIFEPRYLKMIDKALATESRLIGMIQPMVVKDKLDASFHKVGCAGKIIKFEEVEDNRYLITLKGLSRFNLIKEKTNDENFKVAEIDSSNFVKDLQKEKVKEGFGNLKTALKKYFHVKDIRVNTEIIDACKDYNLADQIAMICPLDSEEKQLLLETLSITKRNALLLSIIESYTSEANISEVIKH